VTGLRTEDAIRDISRQDARWVYDLIGPIADEQIAAALRASGADEGDCRIYEINPSAAESPERSLQL